MYRGQDIGSRDELVKNCVTVLEQGGSEALFRILPHITLTRDRRFCPQLIELLEKGTVRQQLFAAIALGSLCCEKAVPPLASALGRPSTFRGTGTQSLQRALIFALGESCQATAIPPLMELWKLQIPGDTFRKRRLELILTALGTLAQNDVPAAADTLFGFVSSQQSRLRARAITELSVASWHLGKQVPEAWMDSFRDGLVDTDEGVQFASWASLENLAYLGCGDAEEVFELMREAIPA